MISVAARVLPLFMQVPETMTTGAGTHVLVLRRALAQDAAEVEDLDPVADPELGGHAAHEALQRRPRAQRADDDVAPGDVRHAPARQLEDVVDPLLLERLDDQDRAGPRLDGGGHLDLGADAEAVGDRGDLVDPDAHRRSSQRRAANP
jgi:hypothetical protein